MTSIKQGWMEKFTEFHGRSGVLAWSLLAFLVASTAIIFATAQAFAFETAVLPGLASLYGGMIGMLLAIGVMKGKVMGSEKPIDRLLARILRGFQLLIACYVFLLTYAVASTTIVYLGQALGAPLQDQAFAAADEALGFDFLAFHAWVGTQPMLPEALHFAYHSCARQFLIIFVVSAILLDRETVAQFCALMALTLIPTVIIASLWPALGSCIYHQPTVAPFAHLDPLACREYLPHVEALRAGTYTVFDLREAKGLLTFPSYHTVMAIIAVYSVRRHIWLLIPFAGLNALNIVATIPYGGHYLVDVFAGAAIAFAAIAVVQWNARRQPSRSTATDAEETGVPSPAAA